MSFNKYTLQNFQTMPIVVDVNGRKIDHDLKFCFCNMKNESRPNKSFELHDHISFDLMIVNLSKNDVTNLDVNILPGDSTSFEPTSARIYMLRSKSKMIAKRLMGHIISDPMDINFYNNIARIELDFGKEDLSRTG